MALKELVLIFAKIERKRHIGNDIVNIIYLEDGQGGFDLGSVISKQTHVLVLVRPKSEAFVKVQIFVKGEVSLRLPYDGSTTFQLDSSTEKERFAKLCKFRVPLNAHIFF